MERRSGSEYKDTVNVFSNSEIVSNEELAMLQYEIQECPKECQPELDKELLHQLLHVTQETVEQFEERLDYFLKTDTCMEWIRSVGNDFCKKTNQNLRRYVNNLSKNKAPQDELGILIFARIYSIHLCVFKKGEFWTTNRDNDVTSCSGVLAFMGNHKFLYCKETKVIGTCIITYKDVSTKKRGIKRTSKRVHLAKTPAQEKEENKRTSKKVHLAKTPTQEKEENKRTSKRVHLAKTPAQEKEENKRTSKKVHFADEPSIRLISPRRPQSRSVSSSALAKTSAQQENIRTSKKVHFADEPSIPLFSPRRLQSRSVSSSAQVKTSAQQKEENKRTPKKVRKERNVLSTKAFKCAFCEMSFHTKDGRLKHQGKHFPFKHHCEYCKKVFQFKSELLRHVKIHTGEDLIKCLHCDRKFLTVANMQQHIVVHQNQSLNCEYCDFKAARKDTLDQHIRGMHGKGWSSKCGLVFKWKSKMYRHIKHCGKCQGMRLKHKNVNQILTPAGGLSKP